MERFREAEARPFEEAVEELLQPAELERSRTRVSETAGYVTNGEYGRLLAPYYELFGDNRIIVCFTHDLAAEPGPTLASVLRFLGVSDAYAPDDLGRRFRVGGSRRRVRRFDLDRLEQRVAANRALRSAWHVLPDGLRDRLNGGFKELKYQADIRNRVVQPQAESRHEAAERRLRAHYADDRERLRALIGREPPW